jgi:isopenicillin-N epimerase
LYSCAQPTIKFPVKALTALAKAKGSLVLIDGAHAPGMADIDVKDIGADLYTGNCHKWLFAPKGTAFLWTKREVQTDNFPLPCVISSTGKRDYVGKLHRVLSMISDTNLMFTVLQHVGRFEYTGTRDYTSLLALPAALRFIDSRLGGIAAMQKYNRALLHEGSEVVRQRWQTYYVVRVLCATAYVFNPI